jgi:hypothetical protein
MNRKQEREMLNRMSDFYFEITDPNGRKITLPNAQTTTNPLQTTPTKEGKNSL